MAFLALAFTIIGNFFFLGLKPWLVIGLVITVGPWLAVVLYSGISPSK
jgi:hypothetical protein